MTQLNQIIEELIDWCAENKIQPTIRIVRDKYHDYTLLLTLRKFDRAVAREFDLNGSYVMISSDVWRDLNHDNELDIFLEDACKRLNEERGEDDDAGRENC